MEVAERPIPNTPQQSGTQYDYVTQSFDMLSDAREWLNERAADGYRLVQVTGTGEFGWLYTMERRLFVAMTDMVSWRATGMVGNGPTVVVG